MQSDRIIPCIERVFGYAMKRTFTRSEAEELTQQILVTVLSELPRLRDESRFEPFLWGIARRVTLRFSRMQGQRRRHMSWDDLAALPAPEDEGDQEYATLRHHIAMLSAQWRDILVLHYFDGLSTREIAHRLSLPEGTVTWRLSRARQRLKEELDAMNETALHPTKLYIGWSGSDCGPDRLLAISSALHQNLLWLCRSEPQTVEALAAHTGVPAYYIEDALRELMEREAVIETSRGRYQSDMAIYTPEHAEYFRRQEALFTPLAEDFAAALTTLAEGASRLHHYTAGRSEADLIWLYGLLAMVHLEKAWNPTTPPPYPLRFDGGKWSYHGYLAQPGVKYHYRLNCLTSLNLGSRGTYSHMVFRFGDYAERDMMVDTQINVCEDVLCGHEPADAFAAARAIEGGYLRREPDGRFTVTAAAMTRDQHEAFCRLAEEAFAPIMPRYQAALRAFAGGLVRLFPQQVRPAALRLSAYVFRSAFADPIRGEILRRGLLPAPTEGAVCDALIQFR